MAADDNIIPFSGQVAGPSRGDGGGGIGSAVITTPMADGTEVNVMPSGAVTIVAPAVLSHYRDDDSDDFGRNLAEGMDDAALAGIAEELIDGVQADKQTRSELVSQYEDGLPLLGTKLESVSTPSTASRSVSRIGHPLLLESMIKLHAGAEAEMLPAAGPAKVETIGSVTTEEESLAEDFESDFNYFLTEIATEYYPDTSSMLMSEAYCGNGFKKIYRCPMRNRPVSESVAMLDLIVSESALTLQDALRVTHQFQMSRSQLRRMQIAGRYRDVDLGWSQALADPGRAAILQAQGLSPTQRQQDIPYTFWETDTDLDPPQRRIEGKWERRAPAGLPLPYKVTVDEQTRQVLGIWRNWRDGDPLYMKRNMYVHYGMVPTGLGFLHWGFLHILGNHTRALRAIWRLLIDSGMYSNFPGGAIARNARKGTNEIAPNPGEFVDLDIPPGTDIRSVLMALPYKSIDAVFVQLAQMIEEGARQLGGAVMIETGEGRTNVPVGTIMSMIEQQTQVMAGVHKRNHRAQRDELRKLRELFVENPEDLWRLARNPKRQWSVAEEFADLNLVPASDPNVPSQVHRIQMAVALMTVAQQNPGLYDMHEVNTRVLNTIRIANPDALLIQQNVNAGMAAPPPPDPKVVAATLKAQNDAQENQTKLTELGMKAQQDERAQQAKIAETQQDAVADQQDRAQEAQVAALESADRAADRQNHADIAALRENTAQTKLAIERQHAQVRTFGSDSL